MKSKSNSQKNPEKTENPQGRWYDVRIGAEGQDPEKLKMFGKSLCREWMFQLEKGKKKGYLHFQGRFRLREKTTRYKLMIILERYVPGYQKLGYYVRLTCKINQGNFDYVSKDSTKIDGPWSHNDRYIQKRFRGEVTFRPWQQALLDLIESQRNTPEYDRKIIMVVEKDGNVGKTFIGGYLKQREKWKRLYATSQNGERVVFCAMAQCVEGEQDVKFLLDVPKATHPKHWYRLAQGIEIVQSGEMYDDRHKWEECTIEHPLMLCFGNLKPPEDAFSKDRWVFFDMDPYLANSD